MPRTFDEATWERARVLVVEQGADYEETARITGISLSAVQKRGAVDGWKDQRAAFVEQSSEYRDQVRRFKAQALSQAMKDNDPQKVHAWLSIERAFPEHRYGDLSEGEKRALVGMFIEQLVEYFGAADANVLKDLHAHLQPLAEHLLKVDWRA